MKYFLDTEFIERGREHPIELISIGIVSEDGRWLYRVSSDFNHEHASDWVKVHVLPQIAGLLGTPLKTIASEMLSFVSEGEGKPEFWGYYCDYDWVVICQMFGTMMDLPKGWPMYCNDLKQLAMSKGNPQLPTQGKDEHSAIADARWVKKAYEFLATVEG